MANVTMSCETLAHHLRIAASKYDENAKGMETVELLAASRNSLIAQFKRQAKECREFAGALENGLRSIGFDSSDRIELETLEG